MMPFHTLLPAFYMRRLDFGTGLETLAPFLLTYKHLDHSASLISLALQEYRMMSVP